MSLTSSESSVKNQNREPVQSIIDYTHAQLFSLSQANALKSGQRYRITDFRTKHVMNNIGVVINTGNIETLIVTASSTNSIGYFAVSELFPEDIIGYEFTSILCEDGITSRTGKIVYRKDTQRNISAFCDFRAVKNRRYAINTAAISSWVNSNSYSAGAMIIVSAKIYKCIKSHTSDVSSFNNDYGLGYWLLAIDTNSFLYWGTNFSGFTFMGLNIPVIAGTFQDYLILPTINNLNNIEFDKGNSNLYPNIVIQSSSPSNSINNLKFGSDVGPLTYYGSTYFNNCTFQGFTGNICIFGNPTFTDIFHGSYDISILNFSSYIQIRESYFISIDGCSRLKLYDSCSDVHFYSGGNYNYLENVQNSAFFNGGANNKVLNSQQIFCYNSASFNEVKKGCFNIIFNNSSNYNTVEENCTDILFTNSSTNNLVHKFSSSGTFTNSSSYCTVGENNNTFTISSCSYTKTGKSCNNNSFTNSSGNNTLRNFCDNNTFSNGSTNNILDNNCENNSFNGGCAGNYLGPYCTDNVFSGGTQYNKLYRSGPNQLASSTLNIIDNCGDCDLSNCTANELSNSNNITIDTVSQCKFLLCDEVECSNGPSTYSKSFFKNVQNKTFNGSMIQCNILVSDSTPLTYTNDYTNISADQLSLDGNIWYDSISNLGFKTTNKIQ